MACGAVCGVYREEGGANIGDIMSNLKKNNIATLSPMGNTCGLGPEYHYLHQ